jgi:hypothetical protein
MTPRFYLICSSVILPTFRVYILSEVHIFLLSNPGMGVGQRDYAMGWTTEIRFPGKARDFSLVLKCPDRFC